MFCGKYNYLNYLQNIMEDNLVYTVLEETKLHY